MCRAGQIRGSNGQRNLSRTLGTGDQVLLLLAVVLLRSSSGKKAAIQVLHEPGDEVSHEQEREVDRQWRRGGVESGEGRHT